MLPKRKGSPAPPPADPTRSRSLQPSRRAVAPFEAIMIATLAFGGCVNSPTPPSVPAGASAVTSTTVPKLDDSAPPPIAPPPRKRSGVPPLPRRDVVVDGGLRSPDFH